MASKKIKGAFPAILTSQEEYQDLLKRENIRCLLDPENNRIYGYAAFVDGETYTAGPELAEAKGSSSFSEQDFDNISEHVAKKVLKRMNDEDKNSRSSKQSSIGSVGGEDRQSKKQSKLRDAVIARDKACIVSGATNGLQACHIVGLDKISFQFDRKLHYDKSLAVAMTGEYHTPYDHDEWIFELDGTVHKLWDKCTLKLPPTIKLPEGLNESAIEYHNKTARELAKTRCPDCWKQCGLLVNVEQHRRGSCDHAESKTKNCPLFLTGPVLLKEQEKSKRKRCQFINFYKGVYVCEHITPNTLFAVYL